MLREKTEYTEGEGGGYSSKGSKELPLGETGYVESNEVKKDSEANKRYRKPGNEMEQEHKPVLSFRSSEKAESLRVNKIDSSGAVNCANEAEKASSKKENLKEKLAEEEKRSGGTTRSS